MNFNSLHFFIFLAVVLLLYWILPHKVRWVLLLAASYYFYMSWNPWLVFLILGTTVASYGAAIAVSRTQKRGLKRLWLVLTLIVCLGILIFFKYFDFLVQSVVDFLNLFSMHLEGFALNLLLPVGISFYTFQTLSYVIDVYRGKIEPERHFGYYALFVSFFPQLVAGPIERADSLIPQFKEKHTFNRDDMLAGLRIMLVGFFRKCVIADVCGIYVTNVFSNLAVANSLSVMIAGMLFMLQIYGDFAGYSEIAMGVARMMGIRLMKNFDRPFLSVSFTEFFRKWHISLNKWFIDYVYIPLGGNRGGKPRKILNIFIVFLLCGFWHGANWTFAIWGLYAAVMVSLENLLAKPLGALFTKYNVNGNHKAVICLRRILFFVLISFAGLIFRASSVSQLGEVFSVLFGKFGNYFGGAFTSLGLSWSSVLQLLISIVCMGLLWYFAEYQPLTKHPKFLGSYDYSTAYAQDFIILYLILVVAIFWLALLVSMDNSVFLYFQF